MSNCPCKQCVCLAICISRNLVICDLLMGWYRWGYPGFEAQNRKRKVLEKIYGRVNLPTITSEDRGIEVHFKHRKHKTELI